MNNKKYIENFITALENEMEVQSNKKVLAEVEQAKIKLN
jgi:hypothetical protein